MPKSALNFEDILGNLTELEKAIKSAIKNWQCILSINEPSSPEELASIEISIERYNRVYIRTLVLSNHNNCKKHFTIQWGFIPHPITPIIHAWLKQVDTSLERTNQRTTHIKNDLYKTVLHPDKQTFSELV